MELRLAYDRLDDVRILFKEYVHYINLDLSFQSFDDELMHLPGKYALPKGRLYLVYVNEKLAACAAMRPFDEHRAEMKRLYVREAYRGQGIAQALSQRLCEDAKDCGYTSMILDTLASMQDAVSFYEKAGFVRCAAYYENPLKNVVYFEKVL
jgi:ribosomal protein S18 acetylase RimI-like enzyme